MLIAGPFDAVNPPEGQRKAPEPLLHRSSVSGREEKGLRPGGLGILMVRCMVDELLYNEAQNEVLCIKYLES
jgi:hypothetical protein